MHVEPSRHALCKYGNTSSSSIWYEMDYIRQHMDLKQGQRVLQIAFGSGFKCNSALWLCIRPFNSSSSSSNSSNSSNSQHPAGNRAGYTSPPPSFAAAAAPSTTEPAAAAATATAAAAAPIDENKKMV